MISRIVAALAALLFVASPALAATPGKAPALGRSITPPPSTTFTGASGGDVFAIPMWIPSDVRSVRIHLRNQEITAGGIATITGVNLSVCTSNAAQLCTGAQTTYAGVTVTGAQDYVSPATTVTRGSDGKIIVIVSVPSTTTVKATTGMNYRGIHNVGTTTVTSLSGTSSLVGTFPYFIQLEYVTNARRVVVIGDSIAIGYSTYWDAPGLGSAAYVLLSENRGWSVFNYGISSMRQDAYFNELFTNYSVPMWMWQDVTPMIPGAVVDVEVGINDLANPSTLLIGGTVATSYEALVQRAVNQLRANGAKYIVYETLAPCSSYEASKGAARVAYNDWIATKPYGIDAVVDRDALFATASRTAGATLSATYDSGDGCHLSAAGSTALEAAVYAAISALP